MEATSSARTCSGSSIWGRTRLRRPVPWDSPPTGAIMNSWKSSGLRACAPPLTTLKWRTGTRGAHDLSTSPVGGAAVCWSRSTPRAAAPPPSKCHNGTACADAAAPAAAIDTPTTRWRRAWRGWASRQARAARHPPRPHRRGSPGACRTAQPRSRCRRCERPEGHPLPCSPSPHTGSAGLPLLAVRVDLSDGMDSDAGWSPSRGVGTAARMTNRQNRRILAGLGDGTHPNTAFWLTVPG